MKKLDEVYSLLAVAVSQAQPTDNPDVTKNVRDAYYLVREKMRALLSPTVDGEE